MRITKIKVNGFKSLVDFDMDLSKFNCLIGLNGSGKSTVLQFMDFLSQLVRGDMDGWLKERQWNKNEIGSKLPSRKQTVDFFVIFQGDDNLFFDWEGRYNINESRCTQEIFTWFWFTEEGQRVGKNLLLVSAQKLFLSYPETDGKVMKRQKIDFKYDGSIVSQIRPDALSDKFESLLPFVESLHSFDMLAPQSLRKRDRRSDGSIGLSGQRLSAFLHELGHERRNELSQKLKQAYPHLDNVTTHSLKSGWKELVIREGYSDNILHTEARHINDGMLRLIAILAELESEHDFLLFDEIENGINPELVEFLIEILTNARQQIMVTTHSPMILNYLDDETAQESVVYLHKTEEGSTRAIKFFDIPSISTKLEIMGPGEAFVDTDLVALGDEIKNLTPKEEK